jgi:hypothetical protein
VEYKSAFRRGGAALDKHGVPLANAAMTPALEARARAAGA